MRLALTTGLAATAVAAGLASSAQAGTFASINIDGSFADWDAVPLAATDPMGDNVRDLVGLKLANDATNFYALVIYGSAVVPSADNGTYLAIDSDNDTATGFNAAASEIGSNTGFANDFPFTQTSAFNSGGTVTTSFNAAPLGTATTMQEIAIPRSSSQVDASAGGFTGNLFPVDGGTILFTAYTLQPSFAIDDFVGAASYTFAAPGGVVPEPATAGLLLAGVAGMALRRRRA